MVRASVSLSFLVLLFAPIVQAQTTYTVAYTYDAQGRLTQAVYGDAFTVAYTYDAAGNRLKREAYEGAPVAAEAEAAVPERFALHGNYPNPFNPATTLRFDLPAPARVRVTVYDVLGRAVLRLPAQEVSAGFRRTLRLDASALASGVYLYRLVAAAEAGTATQTGRFVVVK